MPRQALPSTHRSASAEAAHRAGRVTGTLDLSTPPALAVRQRVMTAAARNGVALALIAAGIWIYDVARVVRGS